MRFTYRLSFIFLFLLTSLSSAFGNEKSLRKIEFSTTELNFENCSKFSESPILPIKIKNLTKRFSFEEYLPYRKCTIDDHYVVEFRKHPIHEYLWARITEKSSGQTRHLPPGGCQHYPLFEEKRSIYFLRANQKIYATMAYGVCVNSEYKAQSVYEDQQKFITLIGLSEFSAIGLSKYFDQHPDLFKFMVEKAQRIYKLELKKRNSVKN